MLIMITTANLITAFFTFGILCFFQDFAFLLVRRLIDAVRFKFRP